MLLMGLCGFGIVYFAVKYIRERKSKRLLVDEEEDLNDIERLKREKFRDF
jgi:hypothetical protein